MHELRSKSISDADVYPNILTADRTFFIESMSSLQVSVDRLRPKRGYQITSCLVARTKMLRDSVRV